MEPDEEQSVGDGQFRLRRNAPAQHVQLMPQQQDLGFQPCLRLQRRDQDMQDEAKKRYHRGPTYSFPPSTPVDEVLSMESLSKVILFGERSLRGALSEYIDHFHTEKNHQRTGNGLLFPRNTDRDGGLRVRCAERLGGLLRYYHRETA